MMNQVQERLLYQIAGLKEKPEKGAYNIRLDGGSLGYQSTENIAIQPMADGGGLHITIKPGTVGETVHIPVLISKSGHQEKVVNVFEIGADCDITIVAGCGIHNDGAIASQHDGLHEFKVGENAKVRYVENHYGEGNAESGRVFNPETVLHLAPGSNMEIETVQIEGVTSTKRLTKATVGDGATLVIKEKLLTDGDQYAETAFDVDLAGVDSSTNVISRSVAKGNSKQVFLSKIDGNNQCYGHSECDAIIMDGAMVQAIPQVTANHVDATLIHEAAIGKIAGEQIIKLMTLGLTEEEAEQEIVQGFLK
ncbi:SufD family Fe-S cluster assembly protein [Eubacteriales bacterium OttesenSCG-928-M02]|nr:SufD family Fe-S cluster assembly protein [Eubacteriales bacterium OttesenSCG-928-M02]